MASPIRGQWSLATDLYYVYGFHLSRLSLLFAFLAFLALVGLMMVSFLFPMFSLPIMTRVTHAWDRRLKEQKTDLLTRNYEKMQLIMGSQPST